MPNLGDYLGQVLSEITIARMQADVEAVRVAELYANHPLLRTMSVPRFRLPTVELDIPVAIGNVADVPPGQPPRGAVPIADLRRQFDDLLAQQVAKHGIPLDDQQRETLVRTVDAEAARLDQPPEIAVDSNRVADSLTAVAAEALSRLAEPGTIEALKGDLQQEARLQFLKARVPPPRIEALVTTQQLRDAGPEQVLTRLHLTISEQGLEWTQIETGSELQDRLVPE